MTEFLLTIACKDLYNAIDSAADTTNKSITVIIFPSILS
jgi:hypothetical protein